MDCFLPHSCLGFVLRLLLSVVSMTGREGLPLSADTNPFKGNSGYLGTLVLYGNRVRVHDVGRYRGTEGIFPYFDLYSTTLP